MPTKYQYHRGRKHLDYLTGATRHNPPRSISPTRGYMTSNSPESGEMFAQASDNRNTFLRYTRQPQRPRRQVEEQKPS